MDDAHDMYPSTFDCEEQGGFPPMAGGAPDWILGCVENARARVAAGHSTASYIEHAEDTVYVCAAAAMYLAVGISERDVKSGYNGMVLLHHLEEQFSEEAKAAIDLVSQAALELHPESENYGNWAGPLEWVNQVWVPESIVPAFKEKYRDEPAILANELSLRRFWITIDPAGHSIMVKKEILRIYDHAIEMRQGQLVH